ncbi:BnaC03g16280D [Brassica napus]|uniref:BnaC03g16280D protein n=1 Tax=Brassica napus TaxID=3708 RepID=A0A078I4K1_BRANA|nr:BnaC03g16280D [Brassica napus]
MFFVDVDGEGGGW